MMSNLDRATDRRHPVMRALGVGAMRETRVHMNMQDSV